MCTTCFFVAIFNRKNAIMPQKTFTKTQELLTIGNK